MAGRAIIMLLAAAAAIALGVALSGRERYLITLEDFRKTFEELRGKGVVK